MRSTLWNTSRLHQEELAAGEHQRDHEHRRKTQDDRAPRGGGMPVTPWAA
jgi:hypothetical protein